jgi:4-amino-4-deoxy-L-arabinose transferase-like glycosyltransferase
MPQIQTLIHQLEVGGGLRYLKYWLLALLLLGLTVSYNFRGYKNMNNLEAMDAAQLARNIAEHKGYHTLFIRPFSMYLLEKTYIDKHGPIPLGQARDIDSCQIRGPHPDLSNPPVYPLVLAGLMKLGAGFRYQPATASTLNIGKKHLNTWSHAGAFWIYPPDFWISMFNQCLFLAMVVVLFFLARRLLDRAVAWTSAVVFLGTDLFWRFSISGLSTILVMLIFLALACCMMLLEQKGREPVVNPGRLKLLAVACGVLIGLGCLTRYSFGWLILPALIFIVLFLGQYRIVLGIIALSAFLLVISPWVARNYRLSHTFFGTAGYSMYEGTAYFPEFRLERSLNPDLTRVHYDHVFYKFLGNTRAILQDELPRLGGSWISALFLVGLLVNFRNPTLKRLRYFLLLCLPFLVAVQALGRTQLSDDSPIVNSENLLVLLAPLVIMFGVGFFFILLDQIRLPVIQLRYLVITVFCFVICLPTVLSLCSPRINAVSYPPYYPPIIQKTAGWMKPDELMMSDIPWAVAWYGERQCLWLTLNAQNDFFTVYDYKKTVSAIYLTPVTMDSKFLSQWVRTSEYSWGSFAIESLLKGGLPPHFPLKKAPAGFLPEQLFLTDTDRWSQPAATAVSGVSGQ